jgi:hypothetical protein
MVVLNFLIVGELEQFKFGIFNIIVCIYQDSSLKIIGQ